MPISVRCDECKKRLKVPDTSAGKKIRCPECGERISVPEPEEDLVAPDEDQDDGGYGVEKEDEEEVRRKKKKRKSYEDDYRPKRKSKRPHRGVLILILGIVSILIGCIPLGAWFVAFRAMAMANEDLSDMDSGRMDRSGAGMTQAGKICGIIGSVLALLWLIVAITLKVMDRL